MKYKRLSEYKKKKIASYKETGKGFAWVCKKMKLAKGTLGYHWFPATKASALKSARKRSNNYQNWPEDEKKKHIAYNRIWRETHREMARTQNRRWKAKRRREEVKAYIESNKKKLIEIAKQLGLYETPKRVS